MSRSIHQAQATTTSIPNYHRGARKTLVLAMAGILAGLGSPGRAAETGADGTGTAAMVPAQTEMVRDFSIPAQDLGAALTAFGRQSGLQVAADSTLVAGRRTEGVRGSHRPGAALDILLDGSGLDARVEDGVAVIVAPVPRGPVAARTSSDRARLTGRDRAAPAAIDSLVVVGEATNSQVTSADLEAYQAYDLADVFRLTPSISVGGGASGIAQKIYVRGLEDSLLNVTVDGAPQTSTLFHHIGRVTIDPELLKQVDVQAGAGEATSGAGAIGGAIRFRTKDAGDLLAPGRNFGGRLKVNEFSNDGRRYNAALYGRLNDSWGLLASFNDLERDNAEDGDGNEIFGTAADQEMTFVKFSGDFAANQHLSLSYENRDEEGAFSARPNWHVQPGEALYPSAAERDTVVANYSLRHSALINLEATAYDTQSSFRGGRFDWLADIGTFGYDLRNTSNVDNHRFTYGIDYRDDKVESGYAIPRPEEDHAEEGSVTGLYFQGHSQVSEALLLSYGARHDNYEYKQLILLPDYYGDPITDVPVDMDDSEVSLNAGLSYDITDAWTFGLGYAQASRGKEIGDGFTIDGYLWDGTDAPVVDPDLDIEKVSNIEASLEYSVENLNAKLAVFRSEIDDVIFERLYGNSFYENIGTIETSGFEFNLAWRWHDVEVYLGFASTDSELDPAPGLYTTHFSAVDLNGYEFNGLGNSRGDTWNVGLDYFPLNDLKLGLNVSHVNSLTIDTLHQDFDLGWVPELHALKKPSYTAVDIFADWRISDNVSLNLAVTNLFDELYRDHSSVGDYSAVPGYELVVGPWEAGRDIRLSASFSF